MPDPTLVALILKALGTAGNTLLKQWLGSLPQSDEERAQQAIVKVYDKIRPEITTPLLRLLVLLRSGKILSTTDIAKRLYPEKSNFDIAEALAREMEYRCKFLCLLGLVLQIGGTDYAITRLGRSFLQVAENRHDYPDEEFYGKGA